MKENDKFPPEADPQNAGKAALKEKEAALKEKEALNDKYLRLYSEFDNYRKRTLKEKLEMTKTATESLMVDLLTIIDDFDRAIKSSRETPNALASFPITSFYQEINS